MCYRDLESPTLYQSEIRGVQTMFLSKQDSFLDMQVELPDIQEPWVEYTGAPHIQEPWNVS